MLTIDGRAGLVLGTQCSGLDSTMNGALTSILSSSSIPMKQPPMTQHRHIWVVTGPAGCGKTTVASYLSKELSIPYIEGDDHHPPANRLKMSQNIPLTDQDRWDWLITLRDHAERALLPAASAAAPPHMGVVVTCSALKRKYRDVIRVAAYNDNAIRVHFIYLHASEELLTQRVMARKGHYMGAKMVHSQFQALEEPGAIECSMDVLPVDCSASLDVVSAGVIAQVRRVLEEDAGR